MVTVFFLIRKMKSSVKVMGKNKIVIQVTARFQKNWLGFIF